MSLSHYSPLTVIVCRVFRDLKLNYGEAVIEGSHLIIKGIVMMDKLASSTGMVSCASSHAGYRK